MRRTAIAVLVALAACGGTDGPVAVPDEQVPFPLRRAVEASPSRATEVPYTLAFVRGDRLVRVRRRLGADLPAAEALARALIDGPTESERRRRIRTEIPPQTQLLLVRVFDQIAEVDLSREFQEPAPAERIVLRVAQVVWTLVTAVPEVTAVRFVIEGEPVSVVTADGRVVERPVTLPDYAAVLPER